MLPAANRMRSAADFTDTTRHGRKVARGSVVAYVLNRGCDADPRVGLIVGKAVGGSVQRHRAARRLRAIMSEVVVDLPRGCSVVLRALPGADTDASLATDVHRCVAAAAAAGGVRAR
jgi:ribonuclease P protein component